MRGIVEARALVTPRMRPLHIDGQTVHQVGVPYHWGSRGLVTGDSANDLIAISEEPNVRIMEAKALLCRVEASTRVGPTFRSGVRESPGRQMAVTAFFTDPTVCIGCKACEVACKEWNDVPEDGLVWRGHSYDNTGSLGHSTWRHVKFVEGKLEAPGPAGIPRPNLALLRDVCKHCEHAGCLEACPTGSIFRTEVGWVYVQDDVCNGCGYCVVGCPFGVIDPAAAPLAGRSSARSATTVRSTVSCRRARRRVRPSRFSSARSTSFGRARRRGSPICTRAAWKTRRCTMRATQASAAPTRCSSSAAIPRTYDLPAAPEAPAAHAEEGWRSAAIAAGAMVVLTALAFLGGPKRPALHGLERR